MSDDMGGGAKRLEDDEDVAEPPSRGGLPVAAEGPAGRARASGAEPPTAEPPTAEPPPPAEPPGATDPPPYQLQEAIEPPLPAEPWQPGGMTPEEPPPLPTARELISVGLELAFRSSRAIRNASMAIGLQLLGAAGPMVLLLIVVATKAPTALDGLFGGPPPPPGSRDEAILGSFGLTAVIAALAFALLTVESRIVAVALLGGAAARRPIAPHEGLRRSRQVFWRVVLATAVVQLPIAVISSLVQTVAAPLVGESDEALLVIGVVVSTLLTVPFAYLLAGIVLGGAPPGQAIARSIRLARVRWRLALVAAIAEALTQTLLLLGLGAGIGVLATFGSGLGLGIESGPLGTFATLALALLGTAAVGSLVFTVAALAAAPQVVAFVGLTRYTAGLDPARDVAGGRPVRWVSVWMALGIGVALVASLAGVAAAVRPG